MRTPTPTPDAPAEGWSYENHFGAAVVWLLFLGLGLNIWPGWTRIATWLH
jgi:hypothetical protein